MEMSEKKLNMGGAQTLYNDLRKRAASADDNLAPHYDPTQTYAVGDLVVYHDDLYECTTAITTAEAWTAAHWTQRSVADEVSDLKMALNDIGDDVEALQLDKADVIINTASGSIASFPDGADGMPVKELVVGIEPVQDLHGYENPWPGGGGKNLFDKDAISKGCYSPEGVFGNYGIHSDYIKVTPGQTISENKIRAMTNGQGEQTFFSSWVYFDSNKQYVSGIWSGMNTVTVPNNAEYLIVSTSRIIGDSEGNFAQSVADAFLADYIIADGATIPTYSPYSNICPVSGWTGANVVGAGKNLLPCNFSDYSIYGVYLYRNNVVPKNTKACMTFVDKDTSVDTSGCSIGFVLSDVGTGSTTGVRWCLENGNIKGYTGNLAPNMSQTYCSNIIMYPRTEEAFDRVFARYNIMVEFGATATAYEAPNVQSIPISFPSSAGTVYCGSLTVNEDGTGRLVVDGVSFDISSSDGWGRNNRASSVGGVYFDKVITGELLPLYTAAEILKAINDEKYSAGTIENPYDHKICCAWAYKSTAERGYIRVGFSDGMGIDTVEKLNEWKANNAVQIYYPIASPITYDLTALEVVETLKGVNNIWADTGDTTVTYRADTKLYIDNKITQAIAAALNA